MARQEKISKQKRIEIENFIKSGELLVLASIDRSVEKRIKEIKRLLKANMLEEAATVYATLKFEVEKTKIGRKIAPLFSRATKKEKGVDAVYVIYKDGRLIASAGRSEKFADAEILAATLRAVQEFITYCLKSEEEVNEIAYGDVKLVVEFGDNIIIAAVVRGDVDARPTIRSALENIEAALGDALRCWNGNLGLQTKVRQIIEQKLES